MNGCMIVFMLGVLIVLLFAGFLFTDGLGGLIAAVRGLDHSTTVLSYNQVHVASHNVKTTTRTREGEDDFIVITFAIVGIFLGGMVAVGMASGGNDPF